MLIRPRHGEDRYLTFHGKPNLLRPCNTSASQTIIFHGGGDKLYTTRAVMTRYGEPSWQILGIGHSQTVSSTLAFDYDSETVKKLLEIPLIVVDRPGLRVALKSTITSGPVNGSMRLEFDGLMRRVKGVVPSETRFRSRSRDIVRILTS